MSSSRHRYYGEALRLRHGFGQEHTTRALHSLFMRWCEEHRLTPALPGGFGKWLGAIGLPGHRGAERMHKQR